MGRDDVGGLMQKLMTGSFLDGDDEVDATVPPSSYAAPNVEEGVYLSEMQSATHPAVSRQPTLEANRQPRRSNSLRAYDPALEKSQILREAFGPNALAHKELRIDLFTAFTELTIFIKLITVRGDGGFTAAGFFLVSGWTALQMLLLLFHLREMSEMEMAAAIRIARTINGELELEEQAYGWNTLFIVMHLPFFGYPAYLASFYPWFPEYSTGFIYSVREIGLLLGYMVTAVIAFYSFVHVIITTFYGLIKVPGLWKVPFLLTVPTLFAWLSASCLSNMQQNSLEGSTSCPEDFTSFFEPHSPMYYIVDKSLDVIIKGIWLLFFLALMSIVYFTTVMPNEDSDLLASPNSASTARKRSSLGHALFVLVVFLLYLIWYDPSQTSKPTWTDVLG